MNYRKGLLLSALVVSAALSFADRPPAWMVGKWHGTNPVSDRRVVIDIRWDGSLIYVSKRGNDVARDSGVYDNGLIKAGGNRLRPQRVGRLMRVVNVETRRSFDLTSGGSPWPDFQPVIPPGTGWQGSGMSLSFDEPRGGMVSGRDRVVFSGRSNARYVELEVRKHNGKRVVYRRIAVTRGGWRTTELLKGNGNYDATVRASRQGRPTLTRRISFIVSMRP